jgi:hypothetical protein
MKAQAVDLTINTNLHVITKNKYLVSKIRIEFH